MVEWVDRSLAKEEHQKVENVKFVEMNNRVQKAYMNKEVRSKEEAPKSSAMQDAEEDVMLRFEQGKNLYDLD